MHDIYFDETMINKDKFIHDYQRFAKPVGYFIDWDVQCEMVARIINFSDDNFYTLTRYETKDGFEHNFEFRRYKVDYITKIEYIGCF